MMIQSTLQFECERDRQQVGQIALVTRSLLIIPTFSIRDDAIGEQIASWWQNFRFS
jgi:hypothetical protein